MSEDQPMSDAEKMRLKRLARLGGSATPQPSSTSPQPKESTEQPKEISQPVASSSRLVLDPITRSSSKPVATPPPAKAPQPSPKPLASASTSTLGKHPSSEMASASASIPARARLPYTPRITYDQWEENTVGEVFGVTLSRSAAERSEWRACWLKELESELKEEKLEARTKIDMADRLLIARLSLDTAAMAQSDDPDILTVLAGMPSEETSLEYLMGCWKRLSGANKAFRRLAYAEVAQWTAAHEKLKGLIISYCGMSLEDPSMFPQPANKPTGPAEFLPILLSLTSTTSPSGDPFTSSSSTKPVSPTFLPPDDVPPFLNDLAAGVSPEQLVDTITPTLSLFFQEWFAVSPAPDLLGTEWQQYLGAVSTLVQVKQIAAAMPSLDIWVAKGVTAPKIEYASLLGPLVRLSVYPREFASIWKTYFSDPTERKKDDIDANKGNLRHTLAALHQSLFNIFNAIVRASPEAREGILAFMAQVIELNDKRAGMRVDPRSVSSDGYMTNLQVVMLKLFAPVMDASFSKIDKIDPEYYRRSKRIKIEDETKIRATKQEADEYFGAAMESGPPPNFVSDLFFLLNSFQHLGMVKTVGNRDRAEKTLSEIEKELKRTEASRGDWEGNAALQAQGEAAIKKHKADIATLHASIHAYDTQLLDPALVRLNVNYLGFLMTWLIRLVDPKRQHPAVQITLPLPDIAPLDFRMLPEYLIENISEYLHFVTRYDPDALDNVDKDILITFAVTFLSPGYINNPFLKAKLVSILAHGLYPVGYFRQGMLFDRLSVNTHSTQYLMPTLIRFFIDVEATGGHSQFWDKFNFRRDITKIFKSMWSNPLHREAFVKSRHDDFDQFIKFINMLMSDTTFHLEESLTNLAKINQLQQQLAAGSVPEVDRADATSQLQQAEGAAPWHTQMGLDNVELIRDLTANSKEPFVVGEIVDRLAASLNENLVNLVGPKMQDLKVADPDKFYFKPKRLLAAIAQIYLNLGEETDFVRAVANDGRSYTKELFERFARVLKHRAIMTESEVGEVVAFTQRVEDMKATIAMEDEREIPDDFLDPLLSTLMRDPVILPTSKISIDRATIRTVLLSKELDPFNNQPLKMEDCVPDVDLKARIDAWLAEGNTKPADIMEVDDL